MAETLICDKGVNEFWVGNYGQFDKLCARAISEIKKKYPHIVLILIIPYLTKELNENKDYYNTKYDGILLASLPENIPPRYKIIKANRYMVDRSDFLICCIEHSWGGAYKTVEYAKGKNNITVYNVSYNR